VGWICIRGAKPKLHAIAMIACVATSAVFLGCYLLYHFQVRGSVPFRGEGVLRFLYFAILISHTILAIAVVPLVILALRRAVAKKFLEHARIAQVLFPVWMYVSVTGVVVYWMLYQMPAAGYT
jgi:uncharacterized membrane protein YozB (DUF420 family)